MRSAQLRQPAVTVLRTAVLDVSEFFAQRQGEGSARLRVDETFRSQLADRRHDRRRATGEDLDDVARFHAVTPFRERNGAALDTVPTVLRQLQNRVARHAIENA